MNLIGHEDIRSRLLDLYKRKRLPGGLLLSGPQAVGKYALAKAFATYLLAGDQAEPFNVPESHPVARRIASGGHGDIMIIQKGLNAEGKTARDISVEETRNVIRFMQKTPLEGGWRIALIDSVDDLNRNAANALLKILEEPPSQAILILISHSPAKVLPTIRSRCQEAIFHPLSALQMRTYLKPCDLNDQEIEEIIDLSEGRPGYALQLIDSKGLLIYKDLLKAMTESSKSGASAYFNLVDHYGAAPLREGKIDTFETLGRLLLTCLARLVEYAVSSQESRIENEKEAFKIALCQHSIDQWIKIWQKAIRDLNQAHRFSLNRKQVLAGLFEQFA